MNVTFTNTNTDSYLKIIINSYPMANIYLVVTPFGNCQTFTLCNASYFRYIEDKDIPKLLKEIVERAGKRQMVIDLNEILSEMIIEKLNPFIINIQSMPYQSTNGSKMILHLIQLTSNLFD